VIIIFYYQSDLVSNIIYSEKFQVVTTEEPMSHYEEEKDSDSDSDSDSDEHDIMAANNDERINIDDAYAHHKLPIQSESETIFRNQNCSKNLELI